MPTAQIYLNCLSNKAVAKLAMKNENTKVFLGILALLLITLSVFSDYSAQARSSKKVLAMNALFPEQINSDDISLTTSNSISLSPSEINAQRIRQAFGVSMSKTLSSYTFAVTVLGKEQILLSYDIAGGAISQFNSEAEMLSHAWARLEQLREKKELELRNRFDVEFIRAKGNDPTRAPKLAELYSLEYGLIHAIPSHLVTDHKGIRIHLFQAKHLNGQRAHWEKNVDRKPEIFIEGPEKGQSIVKSLERLILHELGHNSAYRVGWNPHHTERWKVTRELGWIPFNNPLTGEQGWAIRSKIDPESQYKLGVNGLWVRCNKQGQPLNENGERVTKQYLAKRLTASEVADIAMVRPATSYFPSPLEVYAEGMMIFRCDKESRAMLKANCPDLYEIVRREDQREIDICYGPGNYIRDLDGLLVKQSEQSTQLVAKFENRLP